LQVFQRSAAYSVPARNHPLTEADYTVFLSNLEAFDAMAMRHRGGIVTPLPTCGVQEVSADERDARLQERWAEGGAFRFLSSYNDVQTDAASNALVAAFVRDRIRETVTDPATAARLCPDYPFATRRTCVDTGYYEIFNRDTVDLIDVSEDPIAEVTETGIRLASRVEVPLDVLVLATGYDAMTGAFLSVEVTGRDGLTNRVAWADGPVNMLGLMIAGFPNLFTVTGPGSPSVLTNVIRAIEHHVDWLTRCLTDLRDGDIAVIEPTPEAQAEWVAHVNAVADKTLFTKTPSWYCGADIPGKPKVFMPYAGGLPAYRKAADGRAVRGYEGFTLSGVRA
jgi:cyclohexanone monooxygenase